MNYILNVNTGNYSIVIKIKDPLNYVNTVLLQSRFSHSILKITQDFKEIYEFERIALRIIFNLIRLVKRFM